MRIVIIANFPGRLDGGREMGRFLYLGEMFCKRGHQVEMIVSDFDHGKKQYRAGNSIKYEAYNTRITVLHESGYPDNICMKRLWSHYQWGKNVESYLEGIETPDVIYCAIPSLTAARRAAKYCKERGVKFVIDVQDLWPEAFMLAVHNELLQQAFKPVAWYINKAYREADVIVAVSKTYANRAASVNRKDARLISVFLGNDDAFFNEARDLQKIEKPEGILQLCYIGTLGYSYDLKCVIDAVNMYNKVKGLPPMQFVIMGSGPLKEEFERYAHEKSIDAVFTGALPYDEMVVRMCKCDILINPIVKGAAQSITNKVGDYALSGLPVINTQENLEYRGYVERLRLGINCRCGNEHDVFEAIKTLASNPALRAEYGANQRKFGVDYFDRRYSYKPIFDMIESK